ncbi:MAG: sulfate adenylyltransferase [Planctomycetota bacterium]|nr:MAG: sulfate adenylyltransferase [Planctomycetota bacterium]
MIQAHGGRLVNRLVSGAEREALLREAPRLRSITLNARETSDLEMIAVGAMSPLEGFLTKMDYEGVVENMRLRDGTLWPMPVVLAVKPGDNPADYVPDMDVALKGQDGSLLGVLHLTSKWEINKDHEALQTLRTTDAAHPGVQYLQSVGSHYLGGKISVLSLPKYDKFGKYRLTPAQTREYFDMKGWKTVAAFQTRNPIHRAHEYLTKCALENTDGIMIHPLVGETKSDDVPADVRMRCYETLLSKYYPQDRVLLAVYPQAMRYAGPREAILHAICRQNYGVTHIIIGRDHAGVGSYYGSFDAQKMFDTLQPADLKIQTLRFENAFWCKLSGAMATTKTSPAGEADRVMLSGTKVREMLSNGQRPPVEFSRPEVADILIEAYAGKAKVGA